jgi:virginiamycin B lyase
MMNKFAFALMVGCFTHNTIAEDSHRLIETHCTACHGLSNIQRSSGYTEEDWGKLIDRMVLLPESVRNPIVAQLASHHAPNTLRAPILSESNRHIDVEVFLTPSLGQRARDPVEGLNGEVWWVGQTGNQLGLLDSRSGEMTEYPLPSGTYPHSVTIDESGVPWFLGNRNGTIGYLDRETDQFRVYQLPREDARDPHTGEFAADGRFWFTLQQSNLVSVFDPATALFRFVELPIPSSRPYGLKVHPNGTVYVACNGSACLYEISPNDLSVNVITIPDGPTTVRRLDIDVNGDVWFVNSGQGLLGRYVPDTGNITQWPTPSGADSHPYAITVYEDGIWFNESSRRPETLVRFDPMSETFESWILESASVQSGLIRHMRATQSAIWAHQTSTGALLKIQLTEANDD